ncbi:hypothetical protein DSECCO2_386520 [anaerobic digester metagenome]
MRKAVFLCFTELPGRFIRAFVTKSMSLTTPSDIAPTGKSISPSFEMRRIFPILLPSMNLILLSLNSTASISSPYPIPEINDS